MGYHPDSPSCTCDTPTGSENRRCSFCREQNSSIKYKKLKKKRKK